MTTTTTTTGALTTKRARRLHRALFTHRVEVLSDKGELVARYRARGPQYRSFRAWLRAEHRSNPLPYSSPKLRRIVEQGT